MDRGSEPVRATLLFVVDVAFVLEDAEKGEYCIVGEVDVPIRQGFLDLPCG
jgi:hypothetical protein